MFSDKKIKPAKAFEVTVEIGCIKFPEEKYLKQYWEANSESTLRFIEMSKMGVNGVVFDHQGKPISDAAVSCSNKPFAEP